MSAMGKTTSLLERITALYFKKANYISLFKEFTLFNEAILKDLFLKDDPIWEDVEAINSKLKTKLLVEPSANFDFEYDQIVTFGEIFATKIVSGYLLKLGVKVNQINAFQIIKTDSNYREGNVDWDKTTSLINARLTKQDQLYLTQGFIGSDKNNLPVTLGREGSDYSAAILGSILNAKKVTVWKDVPGVMCADPTWIPDCEVLKKLSFHETIELAYFGAKVIHPKTIKPLQNKGILLNVRSFLNPSSEGTMIGEFEMDKIPSIFVRKEDQVLISIWQTDFSFIVEKNLSHIFSVFHDYQVKVNIMQNSAISFSVCVDGQYDRIIQAIKYLRKTYNVKYNEGLELVSIRHNQPGAEEKVLCNKIILLEQKSRSMARYVLKSK